MQARHIIINNLQIRYYQSKQLSSDSPLVFLHGWGSEAMHFKTMLDHCENFIAVDLPGFGGSERPKEVWGVSEYADFVKQLLDKLGIQTPVLAGHSFGGSVIIKYAAMGGSAEKIILIDSAGIRKRGVKLSMYQALAKVGKVGLVLPGVRKHKDKIRRKAYGAINATDYLDAGPMIKIYQKVIRDDLKKDMKKITVPTALIWGADDRDTPIQSAKLIQSLIPKSKLYIIEGAGHFSFVDQPETFREIFVKELAC